MNVRFLFCCVALFFFSALKGEANKNVPEWFIRFQKESKSPDKRGSNKWCAMFQCLPDDVKNKLCSQLVKEKVEFRALILLFKGSIYEYAINAEACSVLFDSILFFMYVPLKGLLMNACLRRSLENVNKKNNNQVFPDEFKDESFKIMLGKLQKISKHWYPGWHIKRCVECCVGIVEHASA